MQRVRTVHVIACSAVLLASPGASGADRIDELQIEVGRLRAQMLAMDGMVRLREQGLLELRRDLLKIGEDLLLLKTPAPLPMAGPFLAGPPPSSDTAGVAKVAVFGPKIEVDSTRRHDTVFVRLRRIEADGVKLVAETELGQDATSVDLPLDRSGALFVAEWSTSEGHNYSLLLKDGATGQTAASVLVRALQAQGRLIFVGYRLE